MNAPRVVVVGAGIAGLAAAWEATRLGADVTVLDAGRPGGKLQTTPFAGVELDEAADAFLARVPGAVELCHELGLDDELTSPVTGSALVWHDGAARRLPDGLVLGVPTDLDALARSGLVSPDGLRRVAADLERAPDDPERDRTDDESVGALVRRRVGDEVFERLVDPLLSGVNAGDADELSVRCGAAQLAAAAGLDASLIRALRATVGAAAAAGTPVFRAPRRGTGRLVERLVDAIGSARVHGNVPVTALRRNGTGCTVHTPAGTSAADRVVLATPAATSAALLADTAPATAAMLADLRYASVAIAALAYPAAAVPASLDASGLLVPRGAGMFVTACSFASTKWAHQGGDGVVRLRVSVGRIDDTRFTSMDDASVLEGIRADLATLLGIDVPPSEARLHRWDAALPQYLPGHLDRVAAAEAALADAFGAVALAGASLRGLGIPACITSGRAAAARQLGELGAGR
jgi:oxygen-dependent protoporphyrinogen oxidase